MFRTSIMLNIGTISTNGWQWKRICRPGRGFQDEVAHCGSTWTTLRMGLWSLRDIKNHFAAFQSTALLIIHHQMRTCVTNLHQDMRNFLIRTGTGTGTGSGATGAARGGCGLPEIPVFLAWSAKILLSSLVSCTYTNHTSAFTGTAHTVNSNSNRYTDNSVVPSP